MIAARPLLRPIPRVSFRLGHLINPALLLLVLYLSLLPLVALIYSSFKASGSRLPLSVPGFSLANFGLVFESASSLTIAVNTVAYVGGAMVLGLSLSLVMTYLLERTDLPAKRFFSNAILSPLAVPHVVLGIAWLLLANPTNGPLSLAVHQLTGWAPDIYSIGGMVFVTAILAVPSQYLLISPQFARFDASFEDAAATTGVKWLARTRLIVLPLVKPAIIASAMLLTIVGLEAFDVPALLGYPKKIYIFSTLIQQAIQPPNGIPNYGLASGYGVVLLGLAIVLVLAYRRAVRASHRFRTITGKGFRPALVRLGRWQTPAVGLVIVYLMLAVVLPLLIVLWASLLPFYSVPDLSWLTKLSLANYQSLMAYPGIGEAAMHTLIIVVVGATATMALACWAGWVSVRRRFAASWLPVEASFLVLGVPGVVMGLALLYLYLVLPIPIYGTVWIIIVAYVTRFMAFSVRLMDAAFRQLDRELEQAGEVAGAHGNTIARTIILPLMAPAVARGWLWIAVRSMGEVPMALLLATSTNKTLAVALWQMWTVNANYSQAAALAVLLAVASAVAMWAVRRFAGGDAGAAIAR
jgi:iron(III) transport system permease protein